MNFRVIGALTALAVTAAPGWSADATGAKKEVRIDLDESSAAKSAVPAKAAPAPAKPSATPSTTAPVAPKKDQKKKKTEAPTKIEGMEISRPGGGFLGVAIEDNRFRVYFYDKDKKPMAPDVAKIAVRWPVKYQPNDERTLLTPLSDGKSLGSEKTVRPPFSFKLYLTLLKDGGAGEDLPGETIVVDYRAT